MCRQLIRLFFLSGVIALFQTASGQTTGCGYFEKYYKACDFSAKGYIHQADSLYSEVFSSDWGDLRYTYNTLEWAGRHKRGALLNILVEHAARKGETFQALQSWVTARGLDPELVNESVFYRLREEYEKQLDHLMIKELVDMAEKDQFVRSSRDLFQSDYQMLVDKTNAFRLKELIAYNKGQFPAYHQIGKDGYEALTTVLYHLDIATISEILPALTKAVQQNKFFQHDIVLYRIDRNIIGNPNVYLYDKPSGRLVKGPANMEIPGYGYHQYYGSVSTFDPVSQKKYTDPVFPERDMKVVLSLFSDLCYPEKNPLRAEERPTNKDSFREIFRLENK